MDITELVGKGLEGGTIVEYKSNCGFSLEFGRATIESVTVEREFLRITSNGAAYMDVNVSPAVRAMGYAPVVEKRGDMYLIRTTLCAYAVAPPGVDIPKSPSFFEPTVNAPQRSAAQKASSCPHRSDGLWCPACVNAIQTEVFTLSQTVRRYADRLGVHERDLAAAAGELLLPLPEPGSDLARLMTANRLLKRQLEETRSEVVTKFMLADTLIDEYRDKASVASVILGNYRKGAGLKLENDIIAGQLIGTFKALETTRLRSTELCPTCGLDELLSKLTQQGLERIFKHMGCIREAQKATEQPTKGGA